MEIQVQTTSTTFENKSVKDTQAFETKKIIELIRDYYLKLLRQVEAPNQNFYNLYYKFLETGEMNFLSRFTLADIVQIVTATSQDASDLRYSSVSKIGKTENIGTSTQTPKLYARIYGSDKDKIGDMEVIFSSKVELTPRDREIRWIGTSKQDKTFESSYCSLRVYNNSYDGFKIIIDCNPNIIVVLYDLTYDEAKDYENSTKLSFEAKRDLNLIIHTFQKIYPNKSKQDLIKILYDLSQKIIKREDQNVVKNWLSEFDGDPGDIVKIIDDILAKPREKAIINGFEFDLKGGKELRLVSDF